MNYYKRTGVTNDKFTHGDIYQTNSFSSVRNDTGTVSKISISMPGY